MIITQTERRRRLQFSALWALLCSPVVIIFLSTNFVNAGNLVFNMIFTRLMGPALFGDLALIFTIKLALLGLLSALQMAVSRYIATTPNDAPAALLNFHRALFIALWLATPVIIAVFIFTQLGVRLQLHTPVILIIIVMSLPMAGALSVARGIAYGRIDVVAVLISSNVEMLVRLGGGLLLWYLGFGIAGVTVAIVLSILVGYLAIAGRAPLRWRKEVTAASIHKALLAAAFPFAVLQLAQVLLLEGDIIAGKILFDEVTAGYAGAIGLFQRIEFFAIAGLAAVLLPKVANAHASGESMLNAALPVITLFLLASASFLLMVMVAPDFLVRTLLGANYLPAADALFMATVAATAFTACYLVGTYLVGRNDFRGIWFIAAWVPVHVGLLSTASTIFDAPTLSELMTLKAVSLLVLFVILVVYLVTSGLRKH